MADLHWYVAYVRSCQERKIAERLGAKGIEVYVPVQKVKRKWSDRVKLVNKLVLPGLVFIHCTEEVRVTRGPLAGFICECVEVQNRHKLIIRLGMVGAALVSVEISDIVKE